MKTMKPFIIAAAMIAMALSPAAAEKEKKITKPRSSEVVIVARIIVSPSIDKDFYSHYVTFKAPGVEATVDRSLKGKVPDDSVYLELGDATKSINFAGSRFVKVKREYLGNLGDIGFLKTDMPKSRQIRLDLARVYVVGNGFLYFDLPLYRSITIPEGVNYVYIGTFTYSLKNEFFEVSEISLSDEFDTAATALAKAYGPDAQLTRVNLLELKVPNKGK